MQADLQRLINTVAFLYSGCLQRLIQYVQLLSTFCIDLFMHQLHPLLVPSTL